MQLALIVGIIVAIGAVVFALQNNIQVLVTVAFWSFEGSLALVLLMALGLGALIAGLLSSPAVIRGQWMVKRLNHQIADLNKQLADQDGRIAALTADLASIQQGGQTEAPQALERPYVGLKAFLTGSEGGKSTPS